MGTMAKNKLTAKQQRFCEEYVVDCNATQAALRAGYSAKTAGEQGHQQLQKPHVAAEVKRLQEVISERVDYTVDQHMAELEEIHSKALATEPVFDADGQHVGDQWKTSATALKAVELKGKVIGAYTEKVEHSGAVHIQQRVVRLLDNGR